MLYNPITRNLFTDEKVFLKKLYCPYILDWDDDFSSSAETDDRHCKMCDKTVVETKYLTDGDIKEMIEKDPELCVKLELDQDNIRVTIHNILQEQ